MGPDRDEWAASYHDAQPAAPAVVEEQANSPRGGPSEAIMRKMDASLAEAESLRQQCRAAAAQSPARNESEAVNLEHIRGSVAKAKEISDFARGASRWRDPVASGHAAPLFLGHLHVPRPTENGIVCVSCGSCILDDALYCQHCGQGRPETALPGLVEYPEEDGDSAVGPLGGHLSLEQAGHADAVAADGAHGQDTAQKCGHCGTAREGSESKFCRLCGLRWPDAVADEPSQQKFGLEASGALQERMPPSDAGIPASAQDDLSDGDDSDLMSEESEASDRWPPRPPLLRFKMRIQFQSRFKPSTRIQTLEMANADIHDKIEEGKTEEIKDMVVAWLNTAMLFNITTNFQFDLGFPVIVLSMLDIIYPKRIKWREVDWRFQYKRALRKNFSVLEKVWAEVNMEKAREFRVQNTHLRLESMVDSTVKDKLEFVRLMKKWFDTRIPSVESFDPMANRREWMRQSTMAGHVVKFPPWIKFDKEAPASADETKTQYQKWPEYKRLIWFLGSNEYQTL